MNNIGLLHDLKLATLGRRIVPAFIPGHFSAKSTRIDEIMTDSLV